MSPAPAERLPRGIEISEAATREELEDSYRLRWEVLRKPHGLPRGSERHPLDDESVHLVVRADGRVVGALTYRLGTIRWRTVAGRVRLPRLRPQRVYLGAQMAVLEAYRHRGIGDALWAEFERRCIRAGVREPILNARITSATFFERWGYRRIGPGVKLFGEVDSVLMTKRLR